MNQFAGKAEQIPPSISEMKPCDGKMNAYATREALSLYQTREVYNVHLEAHCKESNWPCSRNAEAE